ncbi:MAG: hypothetical protein QXF49_05070 [Thermosphaera sp.]
MFDKEKLDELIEELKKLIDFSNVNVQFRVEKSKDKKKYIIKRDKEGYHLSEKSDKKETFNISLSSPEDLEGRNDLPDEKKRIFSNLLKRLKNGYIDGVSIKGLKLKNPILTATIGQSILANVSKQISLEERKRLYDLWKSKKEEFNREFRNIVTDKILAQLKEKLELGDLPTPIFPTSLALSEAPNYYICEPKEEFTTNTKIELLKKIFRSVCGRCGDRVYGLYVPDNEDGDEIKEVLNGYAQDFFNVNIARLAGIGGINLSKIEPFEYLFYLLDKVLQEMFRRNRIPRCHIELIAIEKTGGKKLFYSHYVIPNLNDTFEKLYYGNEKYSPQGRSKIKEFISSFLVENWKIDPKLKENCLDIAHKHINRILYFIFYHKKLNMDSILFLEDLKIRLGDKRPIKYLDEVISWM